MKYRVKIGARAKRDLESVVEWIAEDSESAARQWYGRVREAIQTLERFPERCPLAPESGFVSREIRQLLHGTRRNMYRILFTLEGKNVHVLHIRHAARDWVGPDDLTLP